MRDRSWRNWVEIGGFVAIVVSLVLVVLEIRQNTLAVRISSLQQHLQQHETLVITALENPDLLRIDTLGNAGLDALSEAELAPFILYNWNIIRNNFVAFELLQSGVLPRSQWRTFEAALERRIRRSAGLRDLWAERRGELPAEFRALVDDMVAAAGEARQD